MRDLPAPLTDPNLPDHFLSAVREYQSAQLSPATRRAYRSDATIFVDWCADRGMPSLPATPETVAGFLAAEAGHGTKAATLRRRLAAIKFLHESAGLESPTSTMTVAATMKGILRTIGTAQSRKEPATAGRVRSMVAQCPDTLIGTRDRAILLLGFAGAFRRSELAALQVRDLVDAPGGLRVTIRKSKTDQTASGQVVAIVRGSTHCPVNAVQTWLRSAEIETGAVFRSIGKGGRIGPALSDRSIGDLVKLYARLAGFDPSQFAGHSLRAGFLTSAAESGAGLFKMMEVSRHRSVETVRGYVRSAELFKDHAGAGLL